MSDSSLADWPRLMLPCPLCQGDYPARPRLWDWIEIGPNALFIPDMCGTCESDPRQWKDYEDSDHFNVVDS